MDEIFRRQIFKCPACSPKAHAVAVDGNRKLYRFRKGDEQHRGLFEGLFLAKDEEVQQFVQEVHQQTKHVSGKGVCGKGVWAAARETTVNKSKKLDEEGLEVAVCRHGMLLKGLNMFRGEIFAYPLYLQKECLPTVFFCSDVVCKYWPYLKKVINKFTNLEHLLQSKPFLSIMHAKAHSLKCEINWGGRNQDGAGTTLGEEVEQVNSFLSRTAICTKYMAKGARTDMLTIQAMGWNLRKREHLASTLCRKYVKTKANLVEHNKQLEAFQLENSVSENTVQQWVEDIKEWAASGDDGPLDTLEKKIEGLAMSYKQRRTDLYRLTDGSKRRQPLRKKMAGEKSQLIEAIEEYNITRSPPLDTADTILASDSYIWPWVVREQEDLKTKKRAFDLKMLSLRLNEEQHIILSEVKQHWQTLKTEAATLHELSANMKDSCKPDSPKGLCCYVKKRLTFTSSHMAMVQEMYRKFLQSDDTTWAEEEDVEEIEDQGSSISEEEEIEDQGSSSSEEED
ncbi:uncharacterized protein LOC134078875 [Sardina pilchardus]